MTIGSETASVLSLEDNIKLAMYNYFELNFFFMF